MTLVTEVEQYLKDTEDFGEIVAWCFAQENGTVAGGRRHIAALATIALTRAALREDLFS